MERTGIKTGRTLVLIGIVVTLVGCGGERDVAEPPSEGDVLETSATEHAHTNRLIDEKSPYLLQHAHNPVDWYPWGEEALAKARAEDKPIFLSIGYSTCHWCHVMERESFENDEIAAILNEHYVAIKVDREERPDLDDIYMNAVQAMTGRGGWPMSVWLTPDLKPFFGGTYFPPDNRFGRPGFKDILLRMNEIYTTEREKVDQAAAQLGGALAKLGEVPKGEAEIDLAIVEGIYRTIASSYDPVEGGWGAAPKFPRSDYGSLCLRMFRRGGDPNALAMVTRTLDKMADGGIYDHLGGGFARYSTDAKWLAPHFEKMLYDNAQLAFHYLEAYQLTGDPRYARVVRETFDYELRDMTDESGGFYSAEDADSEGEEGKFYVWSLAEVEALLGEELSGPFCQYYDVTEAGNFEGHNILHVNDSLENVASSHGIEVVELERRLAEARAILLAAREKRIRPGLDDKVLTAWNGLMIKAMARGGVVLDEPRYLQAADKAARFVLEEMREDGRLLRRWRRGEAGIEAYAEDYAMFVAGLLELYQAGLDLSIAEAAIELHGTMMELFVDPADGALFNTRAGEADLLVRVKTGYDGSVPTANSVAAYNMLALYEITGDDRYRQQLESLLTTFAPSLDERGMALVTLSLALEAYLGERIELVLAEGDAGEPLTSFVSTARGGYHPDLFVSGVRENQGERAARVLPALAGKLPQDGDTTAYVCREFACQFPVVQPEDMLAQLQLLTQAP